jgi:hypothetical protein
MILERFQRHLVSFDCARGGGISTYPSIIDAQLERAITEVMALHGQHPPAKPDFGPALPRGRDAYVE